MSQAQADSEDYTGPLEARCKNANIPVKDKKQMVNYLLKLAWPVYCEYCKGHIYECRYYKAIGKQNK